MDDTLDLMNLAQALDSVLASIVKTPTGPDKDRLVVVRGQLIRLLELATTRQITTAESRAEQDPRPLPVYHHRDGPPGPVVYPSPRVSEG